MRLVFDIEANGLYWEATKIWCIVAKDIDTGEVYQWTTETDTKLGPMQWLTDAQELVGHNIINYDLPLLKKLWNWEPNEDTKITDTLVMSRLLNPDRQRPNGCSGAYGPHSLAAWGVRVGKGKPVHEEWDKYSEEMLVRCIADVDINTLVYKFLLHEMGGEHSKWQESLRLEHDIAKIITQQEHNGVYFDTEKAKEYVVSLESRMDTIDEEAVPKLPYRVTQRGATVTQPFTSKGEYTKKYREDISYCSGPFCRINIIPFDLGSIKQVKDYLLDNGWNPSEWNYSKVTGERSSPKLTGEFAGIQGDLPKQVQLRITLRHRKSQIEGWIKNVRNDHRLPAGANPCGTNTGRMRHTCVVNVPKANSDKETGKLIWDEAKQKDFFGTQMRSLFTSGTDNNHVMVGHDASGLELRMLAHFMKDETYIEEILNGDIHTHNQNAAGLPTRDSAKSFIYALNYGAGDSKLGSLVGGGSSDGKRLRGKFMANLPALRKLLRNVKRASGKGYLRGLDGRKVWMRTDDTGKVMTHKALNTLLQHSGSIVMKKSSIILWNELLPKHNIRAEKIIDMHDESQAVVHEDDAELYAQLAVESIRLAGEHFNMRIPLDGDYKVGKNWGECH